MVSAMTGFSVQRVKYFDRTHHILKEHFQSSPWGTPVFPVSERSNGSRVDQAHSALMQKSVAAIHLQLSDGWVLMRGHLCP